MRIHSRILLWCAVIVLLGGGLGHSTYAHPPDATSMKLGQFGHGAIQGYVWSDDAHTLAINLPDAIHVYHTGQDAPLVIPVSQPAADVTLSPDGSVLVVEYSSQNAWLELWDAYTGDPIARRGLGWLGSVSDIAFFEAGTMIGLRQVIANPGDAPEIRAWLWDYASGAEPQLFEIHSEDFLVFNADRTRAVTTTTGFQNGSGMPIPTLHSYDVATGEELRTISHVRAGYHTLRFSPTDPRVLASLDVAGIVRLWDIEAGEELRALSVPMRLVRHIDFSADGSQIITAGDDDTVRVWDVATGALLAVYADQPQPITRLHAAPDGAIYAFGSPRNGARVWDARTVATITAFEVLPFTPPLHEVAFDTAGDHVLAVAGDGTVRAWDIASGEETILLADERIIQGHTVFSLDGTLLAADLSESGDLFIWNLAAGGDPAVVHHAPAEDILDMVFAPGRRALRLMLHDGYIGDDYCERYRQPDDRLRVIEWPLDTAGQIGDANPIYVSDRVHYWGALSPVDPLCAFDLLDDILLQPLDPVAEPISLGLDLSYVDLMFSPGGDLLAIGRPGQIRLLDLQTITVTAELDTDVMGTSGSKMPQIAFDPAERKIAMSAANHVQVLALLDGDVLLDDMSHTSDINGIAFSQDGTLFAAASEDGTVTVWRIE